MTAKARVKRYYYSGISLGLLGALTIGIGRASSNATLTSLGAGLIVGAALLVGLSLATSRCPHCGRFVDLRGRSAYCPRCGRWIPSREGESAPPLIKSRTDTKVHRG
jgi:hypothetical protein